MKQHTIPQRYGAWALVAGASAGLGEAWARELARRGCKLILVARRGDALEALALSLRAEYGCEVLVIVQDLGEAAAIGKLHEATHDLDLGIVVYNAALSHIGPFLDRNNAAHQAELDVNCRGPLAVASIFGGRFAERGRGGIILMSSLSCGQGSPLVANYAATKAYNQILAEGLWYEMRDQGVDVLAVCAGATDTPNFRNSGPQGNPLAQDPAAVARLGLGCLGRRPSMVPGAFNRIASFAMRRLLPRPFAVNIMGRTMTGMYGQP